MAIQGSVDIAEFRQGMGLIGLKFDEGSLALLMARLDESGDGSLDIAEFVVRFTRVFRRFPAGVSHPLSFRLVVRRLYGDFR